MILLPKESLLLEDEAEVMVGEDCLRIGVGWLCLLFLLGLEGGVLIQCLVLLN